MKIIYSILLVFSFSLVACSQTVRMITNLPSALSENSGMLISNENAIWLHNDGGDSAKLYRIDTFGTILKTIVVTNATNVDWEDITYDNHGNVYIGDFGNNANARQDLKVYKIPHPDSIVGTTVTAETIHYSYPEQTAYPPSDDQKKYDTEAMIYFQDSLYFFTKDRTTPHLGYTWLYQISADTGTHSAVLLDSFQTGQISYIFEVTGASISADNEKLALLGSNQVWLFSGFTGSRFFDGTAQTISLNSFSQKEALDFIDSSRLYFSNETSLLGGAQLGILDFGNLLLGHPLYTDQHSINEMVAYPNPASEQLNLQVKLNKEATVKVKLFNALGKCVQRKTISKAISGEQVVRLSVDHLPKGTYFIHLICGKQRYCKRIVIAP
ncbi:T9SS type A sorting domain-containing protein [Aureispira anguillae]|uniref:T9SS type A sorting domain-containing protein n=1 Tax=Aureispira anguillae TaxID=2864201 RepID=A0A915YLL9_9BACT|nr:T9SS type A sorting domain-containing protein [Aureispira anguillae]BDS15345.1 T9SS type A sorting domain-containing protein [Aureispira anguillae]